MVTSVATTANVTKFLVTKTSHNLRHREARLRLFHDPRITCYEYLEPKFRHKRRRRVKWRQFPPRRPPKHELAYLRRILLIAGGADRAQICPNAEISLSDVAWRGLILLA